MLVCVSILKGKAVERPLIFDTCMLLQICWYCFVKLKRAFSWKRSNSIVVKSVFAIVMSCYEKCDTVTMPVFTPNPYLIHKHSIRLTHPYFFPFFEHAASSPFSTFIAAFRAILSCKAFASASLRAFGSPLFPLAFFVARA